MNKQNSAHAPRASRHGRSHRRRGRWLIIPLTLVLALLLNLIPYPQWMQYARPDWVTLVLFYWCLTMPRRVGVGYAWLTGLLIDFMHYTLLGQHAIGKALVALIVVGAHRRLRLYHLWQQCVIVGVVSAIELGVVVWIHSITNDLPLLLRYWQAALTNALLWPAVYGVLHRLSRHSKVN